MKPFPKTGVSVGAGRGSRKQILRKRQLRLTHDFLRIEKAEMELAKTTCVSYLSAASIGDMAIFLTYV